MISLLHCFIHELFFEFMIYLLHSTSTFFSQTLSLCMYVYAPSIDKYTEHTPDNLGDVDTTLQSCTIMYT